MDDVLLFLKRLKSVMRFAQIVIVSGRTNDMRMWSNGMTRDFQSLDAGSILAFRLAERRFESDYALSWLCRSVR